MRKTKCHCVWEGLMFPVKRRSCTFVTVAFIDGEINCIKRSKWSILFIKYRSEYLYNIQALYFYKICKSWHPSCKEGAIGIGRKLHINHINGLLTESEKWEFSWWRHQMETFSALWQIYVYIRLWCMACLTPSHKRNQCWLIVYWTPRDKLH